MTDEELDKARAEEAWRQWEKLPSRFEGSATIIAARLAREGWMPPVDPLLLEARKLLADSAENKEEAHTYLAGGFDHWSEFQIVLAALRRGIEIGEGR